MTSTRLQDIQSLCYTLKQKRQSFQQKWHHVQAHLDTVTNSWKQEVYLLAANNQLLRDEVSNLHYELVQLQAAWLRHERPTPAGVEELRRHMQERETGLNQQAQQLAHQWEAEFSPFQTEHARLEDEFTQLQSELRSLQTRIQARAADASDSSDMALRQEYAAQLERIAQLEEKLQQQQHAHAEIARLEAQLQQAAREEERTREMEARLENQQQHFTSQLAEKELRLQELEKHLHELQGRQASQDQPGAPPPPLAETRYEAMEGLTQEMQGETLIAPEEISVSIAQQFQQMSSLLKEFRSEEPAMERPLADTAAQRPPAAARELLLYGENLSFADQWDEQLKAYLKEFNLTHRWIGRKALQQNEPLQAAGVVFLQSPGASIPGEMVTKVRNARIPYIEHRVSNITRLKIDILDSFIR